MSDKLQGGILAGATSLSIPFVLRKTTDNTEQTGKVASDMTGSYLRQGGTRTSISLSDLAAVNSAYSSGGVKEIDNTNQPGLYRIDLPDAAIATGADWVVVSMVVSGCYVYHERFALTTNVVQTGDNYARLGAPAGASVSADVAAVKAVLPSALVSGRIDASVGAMAAGVVTATAVATDAIDADAIAADAVTEIQSGLSTLNAAGVRSAVGLASANLDTQLGAIAGYIDTEVAAIKAKTDNLPASPAATGDCITAAGVRSAVGLATANLDTQLDGLPTAAENASATWDEDLSGHATAGSAGAALSGAGDPWAVTLEGTFTASDLLRIVAAVSAGKTTINNLGGGDATVTFRNVTDAGDIVAADVSSSERTAVTLTP